MVVASHTEPDSGGDNQWVHLPVAQLCGRV